MELQDREVPLLVVMVELLLFASIYALHLFTSPCMSNDDASKSFSLWMPSHRELNEESFF